MCKNRFCSLWPCIVYISSTMCSSKVVDLSRVFNVTHSVQREFQHKNQDDGCSTVKAEVPPVSEDTVNLWDPLDQNLSTGGRRPTGTGSNKGCFVWALQRLIWKDGTVSLSARQAPLRMCMYIDTHWCLRCVYVHRNNYICHRCMYKRVCIWMCVSKWLLEVEILASRVYFQVSLAGGISSVWCKLTHCAQQLRPADHEVKTKGHQRVKGAWHCWHSGGDHPGLFKLMSMRLTIRCAP